MTSHAHQSNEQLTFVLTLALSGTGRDDEDLERVGLMLDSFSRFFDPQCLWEFIIVTPSGDEKAVKKAIRPKFSQSKLRILNETLLCPEFLENPDTSNTWPKPNKGWYRQQLIKLAIHEQVRTPFYMTVDADVIFSRPFSANSLIKDGKAILNTQYANDYRQLYREDIANKEIRIRRERYKEAERILKIRCPDQFLERWYGETPVLLSKELVQSLTSHIGESWNRPWRQVLLNQLPWTEYALYFEYAEHTGLLEKYYYRGDMDALLSLSDSLWQPYENYRIPRSLDNWNVDNAFSNQGQGIAVVVQSYLGYPVKDVRNKVDHYINQNSS